MKKVVASLVLGLVASMSFAAAPVAPASAPTVKSVMVSPVVKAPVVKAPVVKTPVKHKAHKVVKPHKNHVKAKKASVKMKVPASTVKAVTVAPVAK